MPVGVQFHREFSCGRIFIVPNAQPGPQVFLANYPIFPSNSGDSIDVICRVGRTGLYYRSIQHLFQHREIYPWYPHQAGFTAASARSSSPAYCSKPDAFQDTKRGKRIWPPSLPKPYVPYWNPECGWRGDYERDRWQKLPLSIQNL